MEQNQWIIDKLDELALSQPDKAAIAYYRTKGRNPILTFSELRETVFQYAQANRGIGIKRGDRVVMAVPLSMSAFLNFLSLLYIGATAVPVNEGHDEAELLRMIADADPTCVIATRDVFCEKLQTVGVGVFGDGCERPQLNGRALREIPDPDPDAMTILFSSGTTSRAKGVVVGWQGVFNAFRNTDKVLPHNMERYLALYPIYHIAGVIAFLQCLLWRKMTVATVEDASAVQLAHVFELFRPDFFIMVPAVITGMKERIEGRLGRRSQLVAFCGWVRRKTDLNIGRYLLRGINEQAFGGELRTIISGGGIIQPEVLRFFYSIGIDACDLYGSTEANGPITMNRGYRYYRGGCVEDYHPDIEYRIGDPDESGVGEILVKTNSIMRGYFRDEEMTRDAFVDGYFRTGDLGRIDDGFLTITGRLKDSAFLPNGEKVSLVDAENAIRAMLNAKVPRSQGEVPFSLVPVKTGDGTCEVLHLCIVGRRGEYDDELSAINQAINPAYRFKRVHYVDGLPLTAIGKVKRYALAEMIQSGQSDGESVTTEQPVSSASREERSPAQLIADFVGRPSVQATDRLEDDLGLDSLAMFQLFVELEEEYGIVMPGSLQEIRTVGDFERYVSGSLELQRSRIDYMKYPATRTTRSRARLVRMVKGMQRMRHVRAVGLEKIPQDTNVIICSNHSSLTDPVRILAALGLEYALNQKYAVLAYSVWKPLPMFRAIGAIPIKPLGERMGAISRAQMCLREGYDLMVFPEAHLKRKISSFREGAAMMSQNCGIPVLPLYISKQSGRFTVFVGDALWPRAEETQRAFTERIREAIVALSRADERGSSPRV